MAPAKRRRSTRGASPVLHPFAGRLVAVRTHELACSCYRGTPIKLDDSDVPSACRSGARTAHKETPLSSRDRNTSHTLKHQPGLRPSLYSAPILAEAQQSCSLSAPFHPPFTLASTSVCCFFVARCALTACSFSRLKQAAQSSRAFAVLSA